jgi:hypothetical protein
MARLAYAARRLLEQVGGDASCVVGAPDGFGVHRTVMVSASLPLSALEADPRVRQVQVVGTALGDVALVQVVTGRLGDVADDFDLG